MLETLTKLNLIVIIIMTALYFYHTVYIFVGFFSKDRRVLPEAKKQHRFAALICARNESAVIAELVESLKKQNYPADLLDVYVLADNCTDNTAEMALKAGALVWRRWNKEQVGKGYALDYLLHKIHDTRGSSYYDGYFIFDADNIVDPNFVCEMNKTFDSGYEVITSYRNSKNFCKNWITFSYATWFIHEARYINYPRLLLNNGCAVSGTGFLVSSAIVRENGGWPFHLLTEDIQFSVDCAVEGRKIGYCDAAIVHDEQPETFRQSWDQRMRWAKGFYQVDARYLGSLLKNIFTNKERRMTCYDIFVTIAPGMLFTVAFGILNISLIFACFNAPRYLVNLILARTLRFLLYSLISAYLGFLLIGALTLFTERKRIRITNRFKLLYLFVFPLFMATYIPIAVAALLKKVEWKPIQHFSTRREKLSTVEKS